MKHFAGSLLLLLSIAVLGFAGCSANMAFPDSEPNAAQVSPPLQGSVYGGHAPIVGANVYVLTPSISGYAGAGLPAVDTPATGTPTGGNRARSLMCGDFPAAACTPGSNVTTGGKYGYSYVTTDATGAFNLTGNYNCSTNQAVYIVAVGGTPAYPSTTNAFTAKNPSVTSNGDGTATFTYTTTTTENFYTGESVVVSGFPSGYTQYNQSGAVVAANLTTTTFSIIATYGGASASATGITGSVVATPTPNPAVVNMAAIGICPSSGTFAGTVSYIYMNEVSTTALAYGLAGFGTDAFHIGVATGAGSDAATNTYQSNAYALNGMKQGLTNAALLYDIQGGNQSTTYAGEGHIARATTPPYAGTSSNGTVPQATLDTIGNILAACVDSQNTVGTPSAQCTKLFSNATFDGTSSANGGTAATDIAMAAFNMAHYPAGTSNTSFVSNLYGIPTGNVPFAPNLASAPNDFTVTLTFTVPTSATDATNLLNGPDQISIDGQGNEGVWISNYYGQPVKISAITGFPDFAANANLAPYVATRNVAIDLAGNAWLTVALQSSNTTYVNKLVEVPNNPVSTTPTLVSPVLFTNLTWATIDQTGNYLFTSNTGAINKIKLSDGSNVSPSNAASTTAWSTYDQNGAFAACVLYGFGRVFTNTVDFQGNVYTVNNDKNAVCTAGPTGNEINIYNGFNGTGMAGAVDYNGGSPRFWSVNGTTSSNGTQLESFKAGPFIFHAYANGSGSGNNGGLNGPYATAIDGSGKVWVGNQGGGVAAFNPATGNFLSPANGFSPATPGVATNGSFPAIDRAGDVWVAYAGATNGATKNVYEIIGAATPTITPLSTALYNAATKSTGTGFRP